MRAQFSEEHLSRLVAEVAPSTEAPGQPEIERVWNQVRAGVTTDLPRRFRRARVVAGAGVAALFLGVGGVAAADYWGAHTGRSVTDPEIRELSGPGEHIDPMAPDYPQVYDELTADIAFPDATSRTTARAIELEIHDRDVADARRSGYTIGEVSGGIRAQAARDAVCAWGNEWAHATATRDAPRRTAAMAALRGALTWPAVTDIDDEQTYGPEEPVSEEPGASGTYFPQETEFAYLPVVVAAASGTDLRGMAKLLDNCWPELVPALPDVRR